MRLQTGNPVRGDDYFFREILIERAWDYISSGNSILIAAPRRVGKTSLMYYLLDNARDDYHFLYLITESVNNENEFFRRVLNKVLKTDFIKKIQKILTFLEKHKPNIKKVGADGVEFGSQEEHNYLEILKRILGSISPENKKLIIMIDEFPETLENIIESEGEAAGKHFLQSNRELRQDKELTQNIQFIYTGSIGLENIVTKLNEVKSINDLSRLKIPPLIDKEAKKMIDLLLENTSLNIPEQLIENILTKIEWLIPFYIQLVIQELVNISRTESSDIITVEMMNRSFEEMIEQRQHFEHWHARLRISYKKKEYSFVKELLNILSENNTIDSNEIFNLAVKYELEEINKELVGSLVYDGHINNNDDNRVYRFNSPILRLWWRKNVAN
ncbi:MAG: ATP-binding protein [Desulfobacteraceae bacterium]|jgi:hypothetical protein